MENAVTLERLIEWFKASEDQTRDGRKEAERARDYYDGKQLTAAERAELQRRGQPPVVTNRIAAKVDWMRGMEAQRRTDPRAFPRTPQHEQGAEAATDAVKYVCDNQNWDEIKSAVYENMLIEGFGGCEVIHRRKKSGETEIILNHYAWDRLFYDPHSARADFSDARYLGAVIWSDASDVVMQHPKAKSQIEAMMDAAEAEGDTYDDRPKDAWAVDRARKRVRVIVMHYRDGGEWKWCKFAGQVELEKGVSPYVDEDGETMCPLIMISANVDRDNDRYGAVRAMIDPQDEINKRRSKALHQLSQRQTLGDRGAVESVAAMKREMARPDGHVEIMPDARFEVLNQSDLANGQMMLLQEAKGEIDEMGANDALQGQAAGDSGRAVLAKQQGGMMTMTPRLDRLQQFSREVYRHIWARIRQFWTEEKWVRVTDDEKNARFVGLNRPVTLREQLKGMEPRQAMAQVQQLGLVPGDPRLESVVGIENPVAEIDVDMVLEDVPDTLTLEGETFEQLVQLVSSGAVQIPPDILVETAPGLRREMKDKILEKMQEAMQQQAAAMQQTAPLEQAERVSQIRKTDAEAMRAMADAQAKAAQPYQAAPLA